MQQNTKGWTLQGQQKQIRKREESYETIQPLNYAYMQHLEIIFGALEPATLVNILYNPKCSAIL